MIRHATLALLAGALLTPACAPYAAPLSVTGIVQDSTGHPIQYAQVVVRGTEHVTLTDSSGRYRLHVPARDSVTLRVAFICYHAREVTVHPGAGDVDFVLSRTPPRAPVPAAPDELMCDPADSAR